jgi:MYXO-CTERM domain-containing protein
MTLTQRLSLLATLAPLVLASAAQAAPTVYFGENQLPAGAVSGDPVAARSDFLAQLTTGVNSEGFESYAAGASAPLNLSFAGSNGTTLGASLTGQGVINSGPQLGRFNTTQTPNASKYWDVSGAFNISFGTAVSAFGFYATDIGDFNGQVTVDVTDEAGTTTNFVINTKPNSNNGALLFWGFVDKNNKYTKISFGNTSTSGIDGFGFDDMVISDACQVNGATNCVAPTPTPEPGSLALAGLALAGLAVVSRRRK